MVLITSYYICFYQMIWEFVFACLIFFSSHAIQPIAILHGVTIYNYIFPQKELKLNISLADVEARVVVYHSGNTCFVKVLVLHPF